MSSLLFVVPFFNRVCRVFTCMCVSVLTEKVVGAACCWGCSVRLKTLRLKHGPLMTHQDLKTQLQYRVFTLSPQMKIKDDEKKSPPTGDVTCFTVLLKCSAHHTRLLVMNFEDG